MPRQILVRHRGAAPRCKPEEAQHHEYRGSACAREPKASKYVEPSWLKVLLLLGVVQFIDAILCDTDAAAGQTEKAAVAGFYRLRQNEDPGRFRPPVGNFVIDDKESLMRGQTMKLCAFLPRLKA